MVEESSSEFELELLAFQDVPNTTEISYGGYVFTAKGDYWQEHVVLVPDPEFEDEFIVDIPTIRELAEGVYETILNSIPGYYPLPEGKTVKRIKDLNIDIRRGLEQCSDGEFAARGRYSFDSSKGRVCRIIYRELTDSELTEFLMRLDENFLRHYVPE